MAAVNRKHINLLKKLIIKGCTTKKEILNLDLNKVLQLDLSKNEMMSACDLIEAIRKKDLLAFFVDEKATEESESYDED